MSEHAKRKTQPVALGVMAYFPDALKYVAEVSKVANDQHNPGQPMHWAREKSTDQADCIARHLIDHVSGNSMDVDGLLHAGKVAWRALALLQTELERRAAAQKSIDGATELVQIESLSGA